MSDTGENEGEVRSCPPGLIVEIDLTVPPFEIKCTDQVEKCPGKKELFLIQIP